MGGVQESAVAADRYQQIHIRHAMSKLSARDGFIFDAALFELSFQMLESVHVLGMRHFDTRDYLAAFFEKFQKARLFVLDSLNLKSRFLMKNQNFLELHCLACPSLQPIRDFDLRKISRLSSSVPVAKDLFLAKSDPF